MLLLLLFAFLAGIVTVASPCILPILPIVLSTSTEQGKERPLGIILGFVTSFTFFTLFLTTIVKYTGVPADALRLFAVVVIFGFGVSLLIPQFQTWLEKLFSRLSSVIPTQTKKEGFIGGLLVGLSIGLLWTPCVGPILASVISLALTGTVTGSSFLITLAYSLGTAIPMIIIMYGGRTLLMKVPWLLNNTGKIQKIFGVIMIVTSIGIFFNWDRNFQSYILDTFPNYGVNLTQFEENRVIENELQQIAKDSFKNTGKDDMGKTTYDLVTKGVSAPDIISGGEWFNSEPLSLDNLKGKVVLIDFWTYTCVNCIRTLPYLQNWHEKYVDQGLVIIGVHAPEFEFEKKAENVQDAIENYGLTYPIVQDNEFATWKAYNNRYWPAKYFIDKNGKIRNTHFGEGAYDESEKIIQELLAEIGSDTSGISIDNPTYKTYAKTPELYLGYGRINALVSPETLLRNQMSNYTIPTNLSAHSFGFEGEWYIDYEYAHPQQGSSLELTFESKDVYLVMRPKEESGRVEIYLDDELIKGNYAGDDVYDGQIVVETDKLYHLINLDESGKHKMQIKFLDSNLEIFAFTFG